MASYLWIQLILDRKYSGKKYRNFQKAKLEFSRQKLFT